MANRKPLVNIGGQAQALGAADTLTDGSGTPYGTGTGSVTSVASANADATVATPTTTPVITIVAAPKWSAARTLSYTGNVTGTNTVDGSGNVATALTIGAGQVTEAMQVLANNTTGNVTTARHGYAPILPNDATKYLDGTGAYSVPPGTGSGTVTSVSSANGDITVATGTTTPVLTAVSAPKWSTARALSFTGDVTGSGSVDGSAAVATALTIANSAVTLAKIANAAASSKLLGSGASGAGAAYVELTLGTGLSITGTTLNASGGSGTVTSVTLSTPLGGGTVTTSGTLGTTSYTNHGVVLGQGASALAVTAAMTNGQLLIGSTGADPVPAALTAGTGISVTNAAGGITIATTSTPTTTGIYEAKGSGVPVSGSFAWINQGTASVADGTGAMIITAPANASLNVRIFKQSAPGSTPWNVYARIEFQSTQASFPAIGLVARNSGSGKFILWGAQNNGSRWNLSSNRWASATSFNAAIQDPVIGEGPGAVIPKWLRIGNDGTNLTFYWSPNGWDWVAASTVEALATYVSSVDEIGIGIRVDNGASVAFIAVFQTTAPT